MTDEEHKAKWLADMNSLLAHAYDTRQVTKTSETESVTFSFTVPVAPDVEGQMHVSDPDLDPIMALAACIDS